jgi:hypothetical protein
MMKRHSQIQTLQIDYKSRKDNTLNMLKKFLVGASFLLLLLMISEIGI